MKTNVAVIGCGHWGPNHIRNFHFSKDARVLSCADLDEKRLASIKETYPSLQTFTDYRAVLRSKDIEAVVVATPTKTHYRIVRDCLEAGKDVLCEKPLAESVKEAEDLVGLARKKKKILMTGHVFLFNAGIQKLREYIASGALGRIYYIHSTRTNLGPIRSDVNVVTDLASHDLSIFLYLLDRSPVEVAVKGGRFLRDRIEDVAFISLGYEDNVMANIHVSWLDPHKVRRITVVGDKKMVVWNDLDNVEPVKLYDKGVIEEPYYNDFREFQLLVRDSDVLIPKINLVEPLKVQDAYFLKCVKDRMEPEMGSGETAIGVVRVLERINASLRNDRQ